MELVRFCVAVVKIAIALALIGQLKSCTLELLGLAAEKSDKGMISYSKFTRALTKEPNYKPKTRKQRIFPGRYGENYEKIKAAPTKAVR